MEESVSVIIPTTDRQIFLSRAIESVMAQSLPATQVIVVDNGRVPIDVRMLAHNVIYIRTAPLIGPSAARNVGAEAATSRFVAFLDDDDYWEKDFIKECILQARLSSALVVVGRLDKKKVDGRIRPYKLFPSEPSAQREIYYRNPGFGGQNILVCRDLFLNIGGFSVNMPASVDRDLCARFLQAGVRITVAPLAVAVLCEHLGDRVRARQVKGNFMFFAKHWRKMKFQELIRCIKVLGSRYAVMKFGNVS